MFKTTLRTLAALATLTALVGVTGCSKHPDQSLKPFDEDITQQQADAVAEHAGETFHDAGSLFLARGVLMGGFYRPGMAARPVARRSRGTVRTDAAWFDYQLTCWDANGRVIDWETSSNEEIARLKMDWSLHVDAGADAGLGTGQRDSILLGFQGAYDVTGLQAASANFDLNGTANDTLFFEVYSSEGHAVSHGTWACGDDHVVLGKDSARQPYPLSGTTRFSVDETWSTTSRTGSDSGSTRCAVTVRYDGTRYADMLVGRTHHYRLDLDTGEVTAIVS